MPDASRFSLSAHSFSARSLSTLSFFSFSAERTHLASGTAALPDAFRFSLSARSFSARSFSAFSFSA
jgi:hypothetical protein